MARPTACRRPPPSKGGQPASRAAAASAKGTSRGQRTSGNTPPTEVTNGGVRRRTRDGNAERRKRDAPGLRLGALAELVTAAAKGVRSDGVTWRGSDEANPHYERQRHKGNRRCRSQQAEGTRRRAAALSAIPAQTLRRVLACTEFTGSTSSKGTLQNIRAAPSNTVAGDQLSERQQQWLEADYGTLTDALLHEGSNVGLQVAGKEADLHAGTTDTATFTLTGAQLQAGELAVKVNSWSHRREAKRTTRRITKAVVNKVTVTQPVAHAAAADGALPWPVQLNGPTCTEGLEVAPGRDDAEALHFRSSVLPLFRALKRLGDERRRRRANRALRDVERKRRRDAKRQGRFKAGIWLDSTQADLPFERPNLTNSEKRERARAMQQGKEGFVKARKQPRRANARKRKRAGRKHNSPAVRLELVKGYRTVAVRVGGRRVYKKHPVLQVLLDMQAMCGDIHPNPGPPTMQAEGFLSILNKVEGQRRDDFTYMTMLSRTQVYRKSLLGRSASYARVMTTLLRKYQSARLDWQAWQQTRPAARAPDFDTKLAEKRRYMDAAHSWVMAAGAILYRPVKSQDGRRFKHVPHYTLDQRYAMFEGQQWHIIIRTLTSREATLKPKQARGRKSGGGRRQQDQPSTQANTSDPDPQEDTLSGKADARATFLCSDGRPGKALQHLAAHPQVRVDAEVVQILRNMNPTPAEEHRVPDGGISEYIEGYNRRHPDARISIDDVKSLHVTEDEIEAAIYRMDCTRAPGPDQITVHMLRALYNRNGYPTDSQAAQARVLMTAYVNDLVNADRLPKEYHQALSAGILIALHKTKESALAQLTSEERQAAVQLALRPIVITSALQCAVANAVLRKFQSQITEDMEPLQFACGTRAGQQVMILGMQEFLNAHKDEDLCIYSADTANAYNTIPRTRVLDSILEDDTLRPLFRLLYGSIGQHSDLYLRTDSGEHVKLRSETGVRQGAADSTFGFAKGAQAAMKKVQEAVARDGSTSTANFFADDGSSIAEVVKTFALHRAYPKWWKEAGLTLNHNKSWVYYTTPEARRKMLAHCKSIDPYCTRKRDGSIIASKDYMETHSDVTSDILMPREFEHKGMAESGDRTISIHARKGCIFAGCPIGTPEFEAAAAMLKAKSIGDKLLKVAKKYENGRGHMQTLHTMLLYAGQTKFDYWLQLLHPKRVQDAAEKFDNDLLQAIAVAWGRPELTEDSEAGDLLRERLFTRLRHGGCGFRSKKQLARTGISIVATILKIGPRLINHTIRDPAGNKLMCPGLFQELEPIFGAGTFDDSPTAKTTRWRKAVTASDDGTIDSNIGNILAEYWPKCRAAAGATDDNPQLAEDNPLAADLEAAGADMEGDNQSAQLLEPIDNHTILDTLNRFGTSKESNAETGDLIANMEYRHNPVRAALLDSCPRGRMMRFMAALPTQTNALNTQDFRECIATVLGTDSFWASFLRKHYHPDTPALRQPAGQKDTSSSTSSSSSSAQAAPANPGDEASNNTQTENRAGQTPWSPHASRIRAATGSLAATATTCRHDTLNLYSGEQARNAGLGHALVFEETSTFRKRKAAQMRAASRAGTTSNEDEPGADDVLWKPDSGHVGHETDENWLPIDGTRETRFIDFKTQKVLPQHPSSFTSGSVASATSTYRQATLSTRDDGVTPQVKRASRAPADNYESKERTSLKRKFTKADEKYPHPENPTLRPGQHTYWLDQYNNTNIYIPTIDGYGAWSKDADKLLRIYAGEMAERYWEHYNFSSKTVAQRVFLSTLREEFAVASARSMSTYLRTLAKLTTQGNCPRHRLELTLAQQREKVKTQYPGIYYPPPSPPRDLASPGRTRRYDRQHEGPSTHDDRWVDGAEFLRHVQESNTAALERVRASQAANHDLYNTTPQHQAGHQHPQASPPPPDYHADQERLHDEEQRRQTEVADDAQADPTPLAAASQPLLPPPPPPPQTPS